MLPITPDLTQITEEENEVVHNQPGRCNAWHETLEDSLVHLSSLGLLVCGSS